MVLPPSGTSAVRADAVAFRPDWFAIATEEGTSVVWETNLFGWFENGSCGTATRGDKFGAAAQFPHRRKKHPGTAAITLIDEAGHCMQKS